MLLVAYLVNTIRGKKTEKILKPWHVGAHLIVYSLIAIQWISTGQGLDRF